MDELGALGAGVGLTQAGIGSLGWVREHVSDPDVIAAMFDADANRLHGSDRIRVIPAT
jgi:hypothetical protein